MPSTVINSYTYDSTGAILTIQFVSGRRYAYENVPPSLFEAFNNSFAKGQYYNRHIRGKFPFHTIDVS